MLGQVDEPMAVGLAHVGEALAQLVDVGADERVGHGVDVVVDEHQVAYLERWIHTTTGVGHK